MWGEYELTRFGSHGWSQVVRVPIVRVMRSAAPRHFGSPERRCRGLEKASFRDDLYRNHKGHLDVSSHMMQSRY